ncbi:MAG: DUF2066 domain-containing protein [Venatoribacter sp.]
MLLSFPFVTQAVVVADLFETRVKVEDQTTKHREQAQQEAFMQALVKLSGKTEAVQNELIQAQAATPNQYIRSYRYLHNSANDALLLEVVFAQNQLENLLTQAGLPIWGKSRPLILIWQAVEENHHRTTLSQQNSLWQWRISDAMSERGLPILWPTLDLEDQAALSEGSLWGLFQQDIAQASERYFADAILAGRISQLGNSKWAYRGFLSHQQERLDISEQDEEQDALARKVANRIAEYLANRYAVRSNEQSEILQIQVTKITSFQDYTELLAYLKANIAVQKLDLVKVEGDELTLALKLSTDWSQVWKVLSLDKRLIPNEQNLTYAWQR